MERPLTNLNNPNISKFDPSAILNIDQSVEEDEEDVDNYNIYDSNLSSQ